LRVGIVCRGYGGTADTWPQAVGPSSDAAAVGDESKLLALKSACPVAAAPDRVAAARTLLASDPLDVILADDGLQHYRLQRAFEIAVIDGTRRLGNGLCLPAGPLREPATRIADVDAVVVNEGALDEQGVYRARLGIVELANPGHKSTRHLEEFRGQRVHAVAAIGNPERFFDSLEQAGLIVDAHAHADHAALAAEDLSFGDGLPVLITEKDAVKCQGFEGSDVWVVIAELQFAAGDGERLLARLEHSLDRRVNRP
jgi:tetraacyldisaccharide 4'-kinase